MSVLFTYVASGSLHFQKCGKWFFEDPKYLRGIAFSVRDQAWLKYKAEKGIIEWIIIKKIKVIDDSYRGGGEVFVLYVDTFNALYNESDLIYYEDAIAIAQNYFDQRSAAEAAAECLK